MHKINITVTIRPIYWMSSQYRGSYCAPLNKYGTCEAYRYTEHHIFLHETMTHVNI